MTDRAKKYLSDIVSAIDNIYSFTQGISSFDEYQGDLKSQSAVERQLGIIGEAVNKYDSINPMSPLQNARQIVGFRNRLIHAYDSIDNSIVWTIICRYLEPLRQEAVTILDEK
jgi:uncharacterized protein with HEPN domain